MTNKLYFVANWKMFGNLKSVNSIDNVKKLSKKKDFSKARIIYCPPYTLLYEFIKKTKNTKIKIGAQNCHDEINKGPFTGFISPNMIKNLGADYVILGHSENRELGENDFTINKKIRSALKAKLKVIFCFGENLYERKKKKSNSVIKKQISHSLNKVSNFKNLIFAYEPVWSIGTGKILKVEDLKKQFIDIRLIIKKIYKIKEPKVLYGGSVNSSNIEILKKIKEIDGFLIGGASQDWKKFIDIIKKTIN